MKATRRTHRIVVALTAMLVVTACGAPLGGDQIGGAGDGDAPADKAGAKPGPVTLRLGTEDDQGRPGAQQILAYAKLVNDLSGGQLLIEPVWDANGENGQPDWDQAVARMVVAGGLDMGMIPARAWDTEGVTTLRALNAPFLVNTDELSAKVAGSELAAELLAGLDGIGITGLALVPESLRHLVAWGKTPESIGDLKDLNVRVPHSATTYALFEALGAKPDEFTDPGESLEDRLASDLPVAAEASFAVMGALPGGATAIGNLPLYPKVNSLVINTAALERLGDKQQAILRQAATRLVQQVTASMPDTVGYAEEYCRNGGRIVDADDAFVADARRAAQPVYDELERDATTRSLIERISALRDVIGAAPAVIAPCHVTPADGSPSAGVSVPAEFPEGTYRKEVTAQELIDAGADRLMAFNEAGTWTLTFRDGQFLDPTCPDSTYTIAGGRISVHLGLTGDGCGTDAGKVLFTAGWVLAGDQLQFTDLRDSRGFAGPSVFGGRPFTRIGD